MKVDIINSDNKANIELEPLQILLTIDRMQDLLALFHIANISEVVKHAFTGVVGFQKSKGIDVDDDKSYVKVIEEIQEYGKTSSDLFSPYLSIELERIIKLKTEKK